ncbi:MAG: hypothetical protein AB1894_03295 [Chloroflexota bacterium]
MSCNELRNKVIEEITSQMQEIRRKAEEERKRLQDAAENAGFGAPEQAAWGRVFKYDQEEFYPAMERANKLMQQIYEVAAMSCEEVEKLAGKMGIPVDSCPDGNAGGEGGYRHEAPSSGGEAPQVTFPTQAGDYAPGSGSPTVERPPYAEAPGGPAEQPKTFEEIEREQWLQVLEELKKKVQNPIRFEPHAPCGGGPVEERIQDLERIRQIEQMLGISEGQGGQGTQVGAGAGPGGSGGDFGGAGDLGGMGESGGGAAGSQLETVIGDLGQPSGARARMPQQGRATPQGGATPQGAPAPQAGQYPQQFEEWYRGWQQRNQGNQALQERNAGFSAAQVKEGAYGIYKATYQTADQKPGSYAEKYAQSVRTCLGSPGHRVDYAPDGSSYKQLSPDGTVYLYERQNLGAQSTNVVENWMSPRGQEITRTWTLEWDRDSNCVNVFAETSTEVLGGSQASSRSAYTNSLTLSASQGYDLSSVESVLRIAQARLRSQ